MKKFRLKLNRPHPRHAMQLGSHKITNVFQDFDLSDSEVSELNSKAGKVWFKVEAKKRPAKKKED